MDSEPVGGVLSSWAVIASSTWLDMFHLPCILDLLVRTYEQLAMLSCLLRKVYIDEEWVAQGIPPPMQGGHLWKSKRK